MGASVLIMLEGGETHELLPGDTIGRHWSCALKFADSRLSEAHAMVSLRGASLHLINLRGGLQIAGKMQKDPKLRLGMRVHLAPGVSFEVVELTLPKSVLCLVGEDVDLPLSRAISLSPGHPVRVDGGHQPKATVHVWSDGITWFATRDGESRPLASGSTVEVGSWVGTVHERSLKAASVPLTQQRVREAITIQSQFQTVHLWLGDRRALSLSGVSARILHELVELDGPVGWETVARLIWRDADDRAQLRRRWDTNLLRLRRACRDAGVRTDLLHSDGCGNIEILRYPGDQLVIDD
jgi:hypothetical protein